MSGISDCILWLDHCRIVGIVDWDKVRALPQSANLSPVKAGDLRSEGTLIACDKWGPNRIEGKHWTRALLLSKDLNGHDRQPADYWTDDRGYLFIRLIDGRGVNLAVAIAPVEVI